MSKSAFSRDRYVSVKSLLRAATACASLAAAASAGDCPATPLFISSTLPLTGLASDAALVDVDADGDLDLIITNEVSSLAVGVMLNDGLGNFQPPLFTTIPGGANSLAIGDIDGDLDPDVVVASELTSTVGVVLNLGSGVFGAALNYPAGPSPRAIALGDVDGDLDLDVAVVGAATDSLNVLPNFGGILGAAEPHQVNAPNPRYLVLTDLDADRLADAVVGHDADGLITVLRNFGDGLFLRTAAHTTPAPLTGLRAADMTRDGRPDIVFGATATSQIGVLANAGGGALVDGVTFGAHAHAVFTIGDVDADSDPDVILGHAANVSISENTGFNLSPQPAGSLAAAPTKAGLTGDIDNDGDLDAVFLGSFDVIIARNFGVYAPAIARQPASLASCPGTSVTLSVDVVGSGPFTYQWRLNGAPIAKAVERTLTLSNITYTDAGSYDVVVTGACSSVTSTPATLGVGGPTCCESDFNGDGTSNSTDVSDFINRWFEDQPECGT